MKIPTAISSIAIIIFIDHITSFMTMPHMMVHPLQHNV